MNRFHSERISSATSYSSIDENDQLLDSGFQENNQDYGSTRSLSKCFDSDPVTLTFENLNVFVEPGKKYCRRRQSEMKQILKDVNGIVAPGQLVALMGASGSGKTTLLNVLNSRNCRGLLINGTIKVNGIEIGREITAISAYVQQDDLFIGTLSVREHLVYQALLRLPDSMTRSQKIQRADEVLFELGLSKCRNTKIGLAGVFKGISGGEAKRLAFASEILTNPSLLFCDEPTTGLDSFMAQNVVSLLQNLANKGKTILCTIHQPASEVYAMFDRILFLAEGRVAYFGSAEEALQFFSSLEFPCPADFNPADFYVHTLAIVSGREDECRQSVEKICDKFEASDFAKGVKNLIETADLAHHSKLNISDIRKMPKYKSNFCTQVSVLFWRTILNNFRNPRVIYVRILQKIIMALFVGLIYLNTTYNQEGIMNINGALFFILAEYSFPAIFGVITILPLEFPVMVREHHNGMYRVAAYYLSKMIAYVPTYTIDGAIFMSISYFMIGLRRTAAAFLWTILIGMLLEQTSSAFGTALSAISPSFAIAVTIVGPIMTVIEMAGGLFLNIGTIPTYLKWSQYISWFRYGFEAMNVVQWEPVADITCDRPQLSCVTTGTAVLSQLNFHPENFTIDLILMVVLYACFHLIGYFGLSARAYLAR